MRWMTLALLAALVTVTGCVGMDVDAENGQDGQETGANGSAFSRAENMGYDSGTKRYAWENVGARASYRLSANLGSGSLTVEFLDADGKSVARETVSGPGQASRSETTRTGEPGTWTVVITKNGASGQYALNAQPG